MPITHAITHCHHGGWMSPPTGRPSTTMTPTQIVRTEPHAHSATETRRPVNRAPSGRANISESTVTGWTSSSEPNLRPSPWNTNPRRLMPVPAHQYGWASAENTPRTPPEPAPPPSAVRCRMTVPKAWVRAEASASATANHV